MSNPVLFVIAGCNGSGKSSFSRSIVPAEVIPFDYDIHYINIYNALFDTDIRDTMAHNMAFNHLEDEIQKAISTGRDFCYETNFNSTPLHWPQLFKQYGYRLHLIYFCLNSTHEAKRRVAIRVDNGGHYVPESEIINRYAEGFRHLNVHFSYFDVIDLFDTSAYAREPAHMLSIEDGVAVAKNDLPGYLLQLIPDMINVYFK